MSETTRSPEIDPDLPLQGAQQSVQLWIAAPANSPHAPPVGRSRCALPRVVYAERKPRLCGPELLTKYGVVAATASPPLIRMPSNVETTEIQLG